MTTNPILMSTRVLGLFITLGVVGGCAGAPAESRPGATFASPELAIAALADVVGTRDEVRVEQLFGAGAMELLESGDEVADRDDALHVQQKIRAKVAFEDRDPATKIALLGDDGWPFPIPLVLVDGTWSFDVAAGREEIDNRRVGRNELSTIASLHEYVDAQREYRSVGRDGLPPAYARRVVSSDGKRDGLYWPAGENEPASPLGPLIAAAARDGYDQVARRPEGELVPFHGYYYRLLTAQGANAPGGPQDYLDAAGLLTGGFAVLAWPAKYGSSGVMTFLVSSRGIVYQKDLGDDTEAAAAKIVTFDPDESWDPTGG